MTEDRHVFKHEASEDIDNLTPGTWIAYREPDGKKSAIIMCPDCRVFACLSPVHVVAMVKRGWDIAADGVVSPSVDHTPSGCKFHRNIRLEGWTA